MKNFIFNTSVSLLMAFSSSVYSQTKWTKYPANPVIESSSPYAFEPAVIFDDQFEIYRMWFTESINGRYYIKYAESPDGINWQILAVPILGPGQPNSWDEDHVRSSSVFRFEGTYYLFYSGSSSGSQYQTGLATSADGLNWQKHPNNPIIAFGESGAWDMANAYNPKMYYDQAKAKFKILYTGSDGSNYQIGLAESADGVNWTKSSQNPVLSFGAPGSWDDYRIWTSSNIFMTDYGLAMLYTGVNRNNTTNSPIGLAYSREGIHWQRYGQNPVLSAGPSGTWDDEGLGNSFVVNKDHKLKLWYSGHSAPHSSWRIGYAENIDSFAPGSALLFDGLDDIVTIPDTNNTLDLDDFTIEAWVYRLEAGQNHMLVSKSVAGENDIVNSNFWLWIKSNDRAEVGWELPNSNNYAIEGITTIEANQWYHLAGVRDASANTLAIYINGMLDSEPLVTSGQPNIQDQSVYFGNTPGVGNEYLYGVLDEVRIWNKPLTEQQIHAAKSSILDPAVANLVGYWRFNEGSGQTVSDLTANANHGFLGTSILPESADPQWRLSGVPVDDSVATGLPSLTMAEELPSTFTLHPNMPNPFNPQTMLRYALFEPAEVKLVIYDLLGKEIVTLVETWQAAGFNHIRWNGLDQFGQSVSSGIYFYKLQAGQAVQTRKMVLAK